ncbi:hypothetical protein DH2020_016336 [Rehmannia glutinosa]|uniref:SAWADEE domain-containing protein n=1 Tax=Rehmannia glutinosa TaxID=99300 RepID=A0ABR0WPF1_REHGL
MDDTFEAMEIEDDLPEFTLAEIIEMEKLFKKMRDKPISQEFCQGFRPSSGISILLHTLFVFLILQVQSWFQDKLTASEAAVIPTSDDKGNVDSKVALVEKRTKATTISASEAAKELPDLLFEAKSAKDYAWFDVGSFLTYRVLNSGELVVRVRFAGFGKEEDEWVSLKRAIRERSIPLEHSECHKVSVGDLVLCYRAAEDDALYCDAYVVEIERKSHGGDRCTCIFVVRYDHDNVEGKVPIDYLCCRPTKSVSKVSDDCKSLMFEPVEMQKLLL